MNYNQGQFMLQACRQEMRCPKCKTGTLTSSEDLDKHLVCDQCDYVVWSGYQKAKREHPDRIDD